MKKAISLLKEEVTQLCGGVNSFSVESSTEVVAGSGVGGAGAYHRGWGGAVARGRKGDGRGRGGEVDEGRGRGGGGCDGGKECDSGALKNHRRNDMRSVKSSSRNCTTMAANSNVNGSRMSFSKRPTVKVKGARKVWGTLRSTRTTAISKSLQVIS